MKEVTGGYDLIVAPLNVGLHTFYPSHNCYRSALMLEKGDEAYIQLDYISGWIKPTYWQYKKEKIIELFQKLVANHNKKMVVI